MFTMPSHVQPKYVLTQVSDDRGLLRAESYPMQGWFRNP